MKNNLAYWILGILAAISLVVISSALFYGRTTTVVYEVNTDDTRDIVHSFQSLVKPTKSEVSGAITFSGIQPKNEESGTVTLWQREYGSGKDFVQVDRKVALKDNAKWFFSDAVSGTTYELKAEVHSEGYFIKDSNTIVVTAPATSQMLNFNVALSDIPQVLLDKAGGDLADQIKNADNLPVSVGGVVELNGYIPSNSTVKIFQKKVGTVDSFISTGVNIPAKDNASFTWKKAVLGTEYLFNAKLLDKDNKVIGDSFTVSTVAPSDNLVLKINSTAVKPAPAPQLTSISGFIELNGAVPSDTSILVLQRKPGEAEYTEVIRLPAKNGVTWKWDRAVYGQVYEITSALQYKDNNVVVSNVVTVAAPASSEKLILNSGWSAPAPHRTPSVSCKDGTGDNDINVRITYPKVEDAKQTRIVVGNSMDASDVHNQYFKTVDEDIVLDLVIAKKRDYYTGYYAAYCSDCSGDQYFSGSSPVNKFRCD